MCFCFFCKRASECDDVTNFILFWVVFYSFPLKLEQYAECINSCLAFFFGGHVSSLSGGVPTYSRSARRQISQKPLAAYQPAYLLVCAVYDHVVINSTNFFPRSESQWISMNVNLFCLHIQRNTQKDIHINYSTIHHSMSGATIFRWT